MTIRCKGNVLKTFESVGSMHIGVCVAFYFAKIFEPRMLGRVAACVSVCIHHEKRKILRPTRTYSIKITKVAGFDLRGWILIQRWKLCS